MALSDFTGPDYIGAWTRDLDRRWPERAAMARCVARTLVEWFGDKEEFRDDPQDGRSGEIRRGKRNPDEKSQLLELGVGAAGLAGSVLNSIADASGEGPPAAVEYTGIDIEPALVRHGKKLLETAGHRDIHLVRADLKDEAWTADIGPFDAVFTLQTLHDLGGIDALESVYRQIQGILAPGGILVNADFVVPFEKDEPERPRRLPVETHKDLLSSLGFIDFRCELQQGKMACMTARRR